MQGNTFTQNAQSPRKNAYNVAAIRTLVPDLLLFLGDVQTTENR